MFLSILITELMITQLCRSLNFIDLPTSEFNISIVLSNLTYPSVQEDAKLLLSRRSRPEYQDEKDNDIKKKIGSLIKKTLIDTGKRIDYVNKLKETLKSDLPYRVGVIVSVLNKSKNMITELYNVAIKNRSAWKVLEQLKVFELIIHTDLDTTNLLRQLTETHVLHKGGKRNLRTNKEERDRPGIYVTNIDKV